MHSYTRLINVWNDLLNIFCYTRRPMCVATCYTHLYNIA